MLVYFDPDILALLRTTLDRAWESLPAGQQAVTSRSILAAHLESGGAG